MNFVVVASCSIAVLIVMHGITFVVGRSIGRYNVVDVTWGLGFVGVGAVAAVLGSGDRSAGFCCSYWSRCGGCGWPGTWSRSRRARAKIHATAP